MELSKRQIADATEIAERFYPRRSFYTGWSPPSKKETPMRTPEEEAYDRQAAEDRRNNDRLEGLLTPPRDPEIDRLIAEQEARDTARANADPEAMRRELEIRAGFRDPDEAGITPFSSSREIAAVGERNGWPQSTRRAFIEAMNREDAVRKASKSYGGAA